MREVCEPSGGCESDADCTPLLCFTSNTCQAGACVAANPVVCTAMDSCHTVGTCDPTSGVCSNPTAPDGTACPGGPCMGGSCIASASSSSSSAHLRL